MYKSKTFRYGSVSVGFDKHELTLFSLDFMLCIQHKELSFNLQLAGLILSLHLYDGKTFGKDIEDEAGK